MKTISRLMVALLVLTMSLPAEARSRKVIRDFRKVNPCPSTGLTTGACPNFVVDHLVPLCAGGKDGIPNLAWQEKRESYRKDVDERRLCAWLRK